MCEKVMNTSSNEQLSTFIDDELPVAAQTDLQADVLRHQKLRRKMLRYQQIGDLLRQHADPMVDASHIVDRIQQDLAQEPHLLTSQNIKCRPSVKDASHRQSKEKTSALPSENPISFTPTASNGKLRSKRARILPPIRQMALGAGLAAAVAMAAIIIAPQILTPNAAWPPQPTITLAPASPTISPALPVAAQTGLTQRDEENQPALLTGQWRQLDRYLVEHHEYARLTGVGYPGVHINFVAMPNADQ